MNIENNILLTNNLIKERIAKAIIQNRIPIHTTITITNICNFKCLHCYVKPLRSANENLSLKKWIRIIEILKTKGCVSLTITGGEPLCNKDFLKIYEYAYDLNFKITIMSNLSLINSDILKIFKEKQPFQIIGTLYGASNKIYRSLCSQKKGWDIVKRNIEELLNNNINIKLHTVRNTFNILELNHMVQYTKEREIKFHAYRMIVCDVEGNINPKKYQINEKQIDYSYSVLNDRQAARDNINNSIKLWEKGYKNCCAGLAACYINSFGEIYLCNHYIFSTFNINELGFDECWNQINKLRKDIIEVVNECGKCKNNIYCGKCNPIFVSEKNTQGFPFAECNDNLSICKADEKHNIEGNITVN